MAQKHTQTCAIASALNIFGDRWTLLIIREAFYGTTRFGDFLKNTQISKNLLTDRLGKLVEDGIMERVEFADRGTNFKYALTEKGLALDVVMVAIQQWSEKQIYGAGNEPVLLTDRSTKAPLQELRITNATGDQISFTDVDFEPGPGADKHARARINKIVRPAAEDTP
ncbi:MAG: helix-turn-helix domain-containing protein [Pseudomonadota bacterium]